MDPKGTQQTQETRGGNPEPERRMDPRLWALLPLVALAILGAYAIGKRNTEQPEPVAPAPTAPAPAVVAAPPSGKISVTEVAPTPVTPPKPATAPPATPAPKPKPAQKPVYQHEEPPIVLGDEGASPATSPDETVMPSEGTAGSDEAASTSGGDRDPVKLNDPAQEYPASAYNDGVQGTVKVGFTITEQGSVSEAHVAQSAGDSRLDAAAVDYVKRLKFRPAIRHGRPAEVRASRTVVFQLPQ